jgi:hypothetical protein
MRIFNGTKSQVTLPYAGGQRITISPMSVSGNVGPTDELIALIVTAYRDDELALIVSGPYELSTVSRNPVAVNYIVQTLDEAIRRFQKDAEEPKKSVEEKSEGIEEDVKADPEPEVKETGEDAINMEEPVVKKRGRGRPKKNA